MVCGHYSLGLPIVTIVIRLVTFINSISFLVITTTTTIAITVELRLAITIMSIFQTVITAAITIILLLT